MALATVRVRIEYRDALAQVARTGSIALSIAGYCYGEVSQQKLARLGELLPNKARATIDGRLYEVVNHSFLLIVPSGRFEVTTKEERLREVAKTSRNGGFRKK